MSDTQHKPSKQFRFVFILPHGKQLSSVDSYPYLHVSGSTDLRWDKPVSAVSSSATRHLNFISHNIYGCPPEVKSLAIISTLEYATAAWDPYMVENIDKLD